MLEQWEQIHQREHERLPGILNSGDPHRMKPAVESWYALDELDTRAIFLARHIYARDRALRGEPHDFGRAPW